VQHTYTNAGAFTAALTARNASRTVTLSWTDNANNETGFSIERAQKVKGGYGPYAVVGSAGANATTYKETVAANTYNYRVRAVNSTTGRSSAYSNVANLRVR